MIYDITQPLFECAVFPGDPKPEKLPLRRMDQGESYNLTAIAMCAHNGTHVDAPYHFLRGGKTIDQIGLEKFIGPACVISHEGDVTAQDAVAMLAHAAALQNGAQQRLLIRATPPSPLKPRRYSRTRASACLATNPRPLARKMRQWRCILRCLGRRWCCWRASGCYLCLTACICCTAPR